METRPVDLTGLRRIFWLASFEDDTPRNRAEIAAAAILQMRYLHAREEMPLITYAEVVADPETYPLPQDDAPVAPAPKIEPCCVCGSVAMPQTVVAGKPYCDDCLILTA